MNTSKILLIHGYGIGINYFLKSSSTTFDAGFSAFSHLIKNEKAILFRWDTKVDFDLVTTLNPANFYSIYKKEKRKAVSKVVHKELKKVLEEDKPKVIVCHSMGAYLLLEYMKKNKLPSYVDKIIFVQADLPSDFKLNFAIEEKIKAKELTFINYYCPWDTTLLVSKFLHKYEIAGVVGAKNEFVVNKLFPLIHVPFLHTSSIRNQLFVKEILSIIS